MNIVLSAHKISTPVLSTYGALHKDAPEPSRHQSDFFVILINHRAGFTAVFPVCVWTGLVERVWFYAVDKCQLLTSLHDNQEKHATGSQARG